MAAFAMRSDSREVSASINITPLVDVLLVLLVIFMLSVPVAAQRLPLLNAPACRQCPEPPPPVRLALKRTGEMYWNGAAVSASALAVNLAALSAQSPEAALEIHPETGVRYDRVTDVLVAARNANVKSIGIAPIE